MIIPNTGIAVVRIAADIPIINRPIIINVILLATLKNDEIIIIISAI